MTIFITNVENHVNAKQYILDEISNLDLVNATRPVPINLDHDKVKEWYAPAIERFRQHRIANGDDINIFDPMIIWVNVYPPGTSMNSHKHPDYHFYSIHYVQKTAEHSHTQMSNDDINWLDPSAQEGDIIFFSGNTYHRVNVNTTDTFRITVGMNASSVDNTESRLHELRSARNKLLIETDWWTMTDINSSPERLSYRQSLRDITQQYSSLQNVVWPEKPE